MKGLLLDKKEFILGNKAIAYGAYEAGATVAVGYPGTPSTEIIETLSGYSDIYTEWSVNEKVALEVGIGASISGARTLVTMKHVGLNVAADPLFSSAYIGVIGGLVIVNTDDPGMHSSQNEQDNRYYAKSAKIPMVDPSDSGEAKDYTKLAFQLSETYDLPVIVRSTTRISHSHGIVSTEPVNRTGEVKGFKRDKEKFVLLPSYARKRHKIVEENLKKLSEDIDNSSINKMEFASRDWGFITSGICYNYVKECFPGASVLKLGMINPLSPKTISRFCQWVEKVFIVEELSPFLEEAIKSMGFAVEGKKYLPVTGELSPDIIKRAFHFLLKQDDTTKIKKDLSLKTEITPPPRLPSFCKGCSHKTTFEVLSKMNVKVAGDIGCYTLGALPPYNVIDTCIEMGGSIGVAQGMEIALGDRFQHDTVAVIGDSTFAHSGITGLLNAAYNKRKILVIVLDNGSTAMTGHQENPSTGKTMAGSETMRLDYIKLGQAIGIGDDNIKEVNAFDREKIDKTIKLFLNKKALSLIIVKGLCVLHKKKESKR